MPRLRISTAAVALVGYVTVSFLYFGWRLLPHPGRLLNGASGSADPQKFVWWFEWWPHAILAGTNPFVSYEVFAPTGINLAWTTSVPALAVIFSPVTLLFGPSVSYNVAAILLPAISAWTAFVLFRYLVGSVWAACVGGYLYGFSSYTVAHQLGGHLHLTAAFVPPLVALVMVRYVRGDSSPRKTALLLGLLFALQAYISIEVALTLALMLGLSLVLAAIVMRGLRSRLRAAILPIVAGLGLAGVLVAPLLYYTLIASAPQAVIDASDYNADLLNLIVPTSIAGLGGTLFTSLSGSFQGGINEQDSYLGLPVIAMIVLLLVRRRTVGVRFLVIGFALATLLSFGAVLHVRGGARFRLPWSLVSDLVIVSNVLPARLALFATMAAAALVVIWIAATPGQIFARPFVLPVLAIVALAPPVWNDTFVQHPARIAFFSDGLYKNCIPKGENLLIFPFGNTGASMLWQAESHFAFRMAEGDLIMRYPAGYIDDPTIAALVESPTSVRPSELLALARRRGIDRVVAAATLPGVVPGTTTPLGSVFPSRAQMRTFGTPQQVGDALVSPSCSSPSLSPNHAR